MQVLNPIIMALGAIPGIMAVIAFIISVIQMFRSRKFPDLLLNMVILLFFFFIAYAWCMHVLGYFGGENIRYIRVPLAANVVAFIVGITTYIGLVLIRNRNRTRTGYQEPIAFTPLPQGPSDRDPGFKPFMYAVSAIQGLYVLGLIFLNSMI